MPVLLYCILFYIVSIWSRPSIASVISIKSKGVRSLALWHGGIINCGAPPRPARSLHTPGYLARIRLFAICIVFGKNPINRHGPIAQITQAGVALDAYRHNYTHVFNNVFQFARTISAHSCAELAEKSVDSLSSRFFRSGPPSFPIPVNMTAAIKYT